MFVWIIQTVHHGIYQSQLVIPTFSKFSLLNFYQNQQSWACPTFLWIRATSFALRISEKWGKVVKIGEKWISAQGSFNSTPPPPKKKGDSTFYAEFFSNFSPIFLRAYAAETA